VQLDERAGNTVVTYSDADFNLNCMSHLYEAIADLLAEVGIAPGHDSPGLTALAAADSRYIRDLKLNVSGTLSSPHVRRREAYLIALAVAAGERHALLMAAFEGQAVKEGATAEEIAETHALASLMAANNVLYRFKHYMHEVPFYNQQPAGLRMSIMLSPAIGKELYELISVVLSAVNGCERCTVSHEHSVKKHGATELRIYDAVRIGSAIKSLCVII
jgi:lipoyl-dependent peroxiredoxin subunit D